MSHGPVGRLIREPLVHFLLLGAALFLMYAALNRGGNEPSEEIVVSSGKIESMTLAFTNAYRRPPTGTELKSLIDEHVKEEVFNREAIKLGLDQNDTIVRRRLQQKMEFLGEDMLPSTEPTEAELAEYLATHAGQFAVQQRFSFRHVFLSPDKHGDSLEADAMALLARFKENPAGDIGQMGDAIMLPREFSLEGERYITGQFGADFTASLAKLPTGEWQGPIRSTYGIHLVLVSARTESRLPALDEIRDQVRRELINARRLELNQQYYEDLLAKYRVTVQELPPNPTPPPATNPAVDK